MSVYDAKFIPAEVTAHSKRCLESTQEVARLLGKGLAKA
jgi:hypothetical protein